MHGLLLRRKRFACFILFVFTEPVPAWAVEIESDLPIRGVDDARDFTGPEHYPTARTALCLVQRETTRHGVVLREPVRVAVLQDGLEVRLDADELRAQARVMLALADQLDGLEGVPA